jgi:DNA-binding NarL/FixJ family response regulator
MNGAKAKVKILIVDDHPIVRQGLRAVLASRENLEVVGDAADGAEALLKVKALRPDIVLMDVNMPGMDGLTVTEALHEKSPQIKVLVLSMHNQREAVSRIIQAGARGYVLKGAPPAELLHAIESVQAGVPFFSPSVARTALNPAASEARERDPLSLLSNREREVLVQLADGLSNKEVAAKLDVSLRTAETHREHIMRKLKIHNLAGLTRFAIAHGLIKLEAGTTA